MTSRYNGISTGQQVHVENGQYRTVYRGARGGHFVVYRGQRITVPRAGIPVAIPVLHKGTLTACGYHAHASAAARHKALRDAVRKYGRGEIIKRVNLLYVFNRKKHPDLAKIFAADKVYVSTILKR